MSKLIGIGIGPGEPELITLKAKKALAEADIVFVPQSKLDKNSVAHEIVNKFISSEAEIINLLLPMTTDQEVLEQAWKIGAEQIVSALADGKTGAFITLGDCMLYSTYAYILQEIKKIKPELIVENIPGVTSFAAAASVLGQPLAEGDESLAIIPALKKTADLAKILDVHENVVFLKVASKIEELVSVLAALGLSNKAVFISKCGHPDQKIVYDLKELAGEKLEYLSLLIVKKGGLS
jgi:precorrin-2/cobalt-factor-2 C20-methyltransferase